MKFNILIFLLSLLVFTEAKKLKILINMPFIAYSHAKFQGHLADILVSEGHDVHMTIHELRPITDDGTKLARVTRFHSSIAQQESAQNPIQLVFQNKTGYDDDAINKFFANIGQVCKEALENTTYIEMLRAEKFDLGIGQDSCSFVLFEKLGIQATIRNTPMPGDDDMEYVLGIPITRSYNTYIFNGYMNAPYLTFYQRLINTWDYFKKYIIYSPPSIYEIQKALDQGNGKGKYNVHKALQKASMVFSNTHELIDIGRPTSSKIISIGGIAMIPPKPLTEEVETIIKSSKNGIVLFSFGSQVDLSMIPHDLKLNFFNAFSKFPEIEFIIKYTQNQSETFDIIHNYRNIHAFGWMDQTSVLNHPKTLAFITHGGRNSLSEAVAAAVPTIAIPLFADQHYNAAVYNYRKIGIAISLQELSEDRIIKALKTVLYDKKLRTNAKTLQQKIANSPFSVRDRFVKYVEFVGQFKDFPELDLPSANMNFFHLYNLDVIAFIFISIIISLIIAIHAIKTALLLTTTHQQHHDHHVANLKAMNKHKLKSS